MDKDHPAYSIRETYYENRRRMAAYLAANPRVVPPPGLPTPSHDKHPMFGPIPPHLMYRYVSYAHYYSTPYSPSHEQPTHLPASAPDHPPLVPPHLSDLNDNNICLPPSPQPPSSSLASLTLQSSSTSTFEDQVNLTEGEGMVVSATELKGKEVSGNIVSRNGKSDGVHCGSHKSETL